MPHPPTDIEQYRLSLADAPTLAPDDLERLLSEVHALVASRAENRDRLVDLATRWPELAPLIDELTT